MDAPRTGPSFRVLAVVPVGDGQRATDPPAGRRLDLWLPAGPGAAARESLSRELDALGLLSQGRASPPAPRLFDRLEGEEPGGVVDACTTDLERWWVEVAAEAEGFRTLCLALADVCRRAGDWAAAARREPALARLVPRIRPRSVLRTVGGRWVLSGFGAEALPVLDGDEDGQGTEVLAAVSHFQPPEELFQATGGAPMAGLAWAIGSTFFSLLKLRAFLCAPSQGAPSQGASSSGRRPELPQGGTDSPHLGSHRAALVEEHLRRRPAAFVDQPLDPRQFLYPDRLPERDRRVVAEAIAGLLGPEQQVLEEQLARDCLQLLDSALAIDPARRYLDPLVMAGDFEGLARRVQALRSGLAASRLAAQEVPRPAEAPAAEVGLPEEPTAEAPIPPEGALAAEEEDVPGRGGPTEAAHGPEDTSDQPTAHRAAAVQGRASAPEDPPMPPRGVPSSAGAGAPPAPPAAPSTPTWVRGAILGLVL
ncbi:hypothetical protein L6R53_31985, partial [Myxococcota bacterium]|nr:hypothetical protein [Myxococcota bacterium]